jgi:hypothetical protein
MTLGKTLSDGGLEGREMNERAPVAFRDDPNGAVAQIAHAVEQYDAFQIVCRGPCPHFFCSS